MMNNEHHSVELPMPNPKERLSSPPPTPWFWLILIFGFALAFVLLILFPNSLAFEAIVTWLFFIVIIRVMVVVLQDLSEPSPVRQSRRRVNRDTSRPVSHRPSSPPRWSTRSDWLGPFNPDDGLSSRLSPQTIDRIDDSMPTTFSDGEPWD
ncbi:hypothetical protein F2Q65_14860 [Thiohalocapsa marina]|uniref:Uncharacterized protein n=1 Tax=Thiohalocapsa marina TaxID=424902 RepID=A0A5M8FFS2_9GAMM|nr:hypothetical protein [Thiohalocapsa marina]KAA6183718.1 hypothetical protein F2Q65_14860 [Thiohalocapsa marina]